MVKLGAPGAIVLALAATLQLHSNDFPAGGLLPQALMAAQCGGENRSPQLTWKGIPANAQSLALIMHDPDAPMPGGFYHWVVYNLPPAKRGLTSAERLGANELGKTSAGTPGYYGPCPPPGPAHHYVFTLYALDVPRISASIPLTASQLMTQIDGHIVARATLTGTEFRR